MEKGLIIKSTGSWYKLEYDSGKIINCKVRGKLKLKGDRSTNPIAVGDYVMFVKESVEVGVITKILPRKNQIVRKSTNLSKKSHVIASNIDQTVLIVSMRQPETPLEFIDRFIVSAEAYKIPVKIIFNKIDIYDENTKLFANAVAAEYEKIGYECLQISATENINIEKAKKLFKDKKSLISGNSGVGKSTLINKLDQNLDLQTDEISDYHQQGKHTTTFAEMFRLTFGGYVIDTPGIKGFGTVNMSQEDVAHNFVEIFELLPQCKFHNCTHTHEPGCAVKEAFENEQIAWWRYRSYLSMIEGEDDKYREKIIT